MSKNFTVIVTIAIAKAVGFLCGFVGVVLILSLLVAVPTMLLWNWLMPEIFGLTEISLVQAFGLAFLSSILFKNSNATKS